MGYSFAENLKRERKEQGLSQKELAARIGVAQSTLSEWETSVRYPGIDKLYDIARCLKIKVSTLIEDVDSSRNKARQTKEHKKI